MTLPNFDLVHDPNTGWFRDALGSMRFMASGIPSDLYTGDLTVTPGDVENGKFLKAGDADESVALLDFSSVTLADGANVIRGVGVDFEDVVGWLVFEGQTENDAFRYSAYFQPQSAGSAKILGIGSFPTLNSGWSGNIAEAAQFIINVQSGATVTTRGGDATAGIHPLWAKVAGDVGATWDTGMRVAPIWSDLQVNGVGLAGEEAYMFLVSAGTSITAMFRWETSAACSFFMQTDHAAGVGFIVASGFDSPQNNDPDLYWKVEHDGTTYGIPLMALT